MKIHHGIVLGVCLLGAVSVQAGYYSWEGSVSDNWTNNLNWQSDTIPDDDDTARMWANSPNAAVIYAGDHVTVQQMWIGDSSQPSRAGDLTIQSGASLTTATQRLDVNLDSVLTSNGRLDVGNYFRLYSNAVVNLNNDPGVAIDVEVANAIQVNDMATLTLGSGVAVTATDMTFEEYSTGTLATASSFTGNMQVRNTSVVTIGGTVTGDVQTQNDGAVIIDGTVGGNLNIGTTNTLNRIGVTGVVDGNCQLSTGDRLVVAGTITNGLFSCNQTSEAVIESTARIYSTGNDCWLYNDASVTWMVGEDGTVGTIWADRNGDTAYDDEVRFALSGQTFEVDLTDYDSAAHGTILDVKLVSDIQQEANFEATVTFWLSGVEHTDVTYLGDGVFRINNIPLSVSQPQGTLFVIK